MKKRKVLKKQNIKHRIKRKSKRKNSTAGWGENVTI
jgi:hypothetical protein